MDASEATKEAIWLRNFLMDLRVVLVVQSAITLYCDNRKSVANSREPRAYKKGNHIKWKYHMIQEIVQRGDVELIKIASANNLADPFTKSLPAKTFDSHIKGIGVRYALSLSRRLLEIYILKAMLYVVILLFI